MLVSANKNSRGLCLEVCVQLVFSMAAILLDAGA